MTIDDWRVRYNSLNAEVDRLRAERDAAQKRVQDRETRMMRYAIELGEMQAERDAARAEAEKEEKDCLQVIAERDEHEERLNRIFSALGMDEAESEWSSANDPAALAIEKAEELRAAPLTAQAGEARAVEALRKIKDMAGEEAGKDSTYGLLMQFAYLALETAECALDDSQPALDWLAQQRAEAAATEVERIAGECHEVPFLTMCDVRDLRKWLRSRAAALRAGEAI